MYKSEKIKSLCVRSDFWESLFVEVSNPFMSHPILIGNIYRPPRDNNCNKSIIKFRKALEPIINKVAKKKNHFAAACGDYNINLLQINEREEYGNFLDLFCSNGFFPTITYPTRLAKKSCSLLEKIFVIMLSAREGGCIHVYAL